MNKFKKFVTAIFALIIGFGIGFVGWGYSTFPTEFGDVYVSGNLQIHFIELGSEKSGDCTLIQVGNTEVLIDAGSEYDTFDDETDTKDMTVKSVEFMSIGDATSIE